MSRFVSAGSHENPAEHDEAWQRAHAAIAATRHQQATAGVGQGRQEGGKSLYETLQANKAAKQEAFEESRKLSHQFQPLDEDEVEFLHSLLASTRAQEAAVKKDTSEQLDAFRRHQEEAERNARQAASAHTADAPEQESWSVGKKRKKGKESLFGGVKLLKSSTTGKTTEPELPTSTNTSSDKPEKHADGASSARDRGCENVVHAASASAEAERSTGGISPAALSGPKPAPANLGLGLAAYYSDEDD